MNKLPMDFITEIKTLNHLSKNIFWINPNKGPKREKNIQM